MAETVVGDTIQVVLQNLLSAAIDEIKLVLGFKKEFNKLNESLLMIQDYLQDAEVKQVNMRAVNRWLKNLEDVAFEADAVLDECKYELLRQKVKKQNRSSNKVLKHLPSVSKNFIFRRRMAHKIDEANKNLETITKQATELGLQKSCSPDLASSSVGFVLPPTDSLSIEPHIVGRDSDESKIVEMILTAPQDKPISVLPIFGMGGLGKTTLARKVFHHVKSENHFQESVWVCVSTTFDAMAIFKMILESLSQENVQSIMTKEVVLEKIRKQLAGKRYFLVLDDLWNENPMQWDDFMSSLSAISPLKRNCIVVTTRRGTVASLVRKFHDTYQLRMLSKEDCWSIIKSKAFSREDAPPEFEAVGEGIAEKCGGLPLVARVVGGSLLTRKSKSEWESFLKDQRLNFELNLHDAINVLKLSYDRLPSSTVKKCFAYCSIFPKDYEIGRKEVIELWMAEGLLQAGRGKDMETMGDDIFNFLLQNSLFQDARRDVYGYIKDCTMHDLVHDLARLVSRSRTRSTENDTSDGLYQPRYLAIESTEEKSFAILQESAKGLRTLFSGGEILDMFVGFRQLHVLKIIMAESVVKLPHVIGELIHLRLFDISGTSITNLPDSIGKLYNLQTLLLPRTLKNLPKKIVQLISLRHLHIFDGVVLPSWMGNLTWLQTLPYFRLGHGQGCGIGELGKLNNLKGFLHIENLDMVKDKEEARRANLSGKANLCRLVLVWNKSRDREINYQNVLDGLQPHPNLKSLEIIRYKSKYFPSWIMKMVVHNGMEDRRDMLRNLVEIKLKNCYECEEVPMFGHLPCLKFLELSDLSNVRSLSQAFYGFEVGGTSRLVGKPVIAFSALEHLKLRNMPELSEWAEVNGAYTVFPCLKLLYIVRCPKLHCAPSDLSHLKELKLHDVGTYFNLADVCQNMSHLESIEIETLPGLINLPQELLVKNQNLRKLKIEKCSNLRFLLGSPQGGDGDVESSLEVLEIKYCPELESIFPSVRGLTSLRELKIWSCYKLRDLHAVASLKDLEIINCPELKSIISYARGGKEPQCIPSPRVLRIRNCEGLIDLPIELMQSSSSSLEVLALVDIPKLSNFPIDEISSYLTNLWSLSIGGFSDSISFDSFNQHLLPNLRSLQHLCLYGKEDWESVPDQIQHLTSLTTFGLYDFGMMEALPEWIQNLSSLQTLMIWSCKRVKHLPSKKAMLSLTKLHTLCIRGCPLLGERCRKPSSSTTAAAADASSSEWPKISHLKLVEIEGFLERYR